MCSSHCLCFKLPAIATAGSAGIRLGERESQRCVVASRVRGRLNEWKIDGMNKKDWWNEWKIDGMNNRLMEWMKDLWNEWKIDGMNERLVEWMKDWWNKWKMDWLKVWLIEYELRLRREIYLPDALGRLVWWEPCLGMLTTSWQVVN